MYQHAEKVSTILCDRRYRRNWNRNETWKISGGDRIPDIKFYRILDRYPFQLRTLNDIVSRSAYILLHHNIICNALDRYVPIFLRIVPFLHADPLTFTRSYRSNQVCNWLFNDRPVRGLTPSKDKILIKSDIFSVPCSCYLLTTLFL